jgi:hypothetical protein
MLLASAADRQTGARAEHDVPHGAYAPPRLDIGSLDRVTR